MRAWSLNWNSIIFIFCSILVVFLIFHPNLIKTTESSKISNAKRSCSVPSSYPSPSAVPSNIHMPPSPLAATETTSLAPPTPVIHLRAPPRPFALQCPPEFRQRQTTLPQQYQPYPAYLHITAFTLSMAIGVSHYRGP